MSKIELTVMQLNEKNIPEGKVIGLTSDGKAKVGEIEKNRSGFLCDDGERCLFVTHFMNIPVFGKDFQ